MNPWWLKPPAEEGPAKDPKPQKPAPKTQEEQQAEPRQEKPSEPKSRRAGRSRGPRRRRGASAKAGAKKGGQPRRAIFCEAEILAGDTEGAEPAALDLGLMLERLSGRGQIIAKRVYGDWQHHPDLEKRLSEVDLEVVGSAEEGAQTAGHAAIQLAIDAVELCLSDEPCETYVLVSESADLVPLVAKLREGGVEVIGAGRRESAAPKLVESCSEYVDFEQLSKPAVPELPEVDEAKSPAFSLLVETIVAVKSETEGTLWGSTLKQEMRRRQPGFDESSLGYATFTDLLEDAERHEVILLERDDRSGGYYIAGLPGE